MKHVELPERIRKNESRNELSSKIWTTNQKMVQKRRVNANLQLMHAFPRLRGFKTLLGADLDPLGVLVDIARMEEGKRESGLWP